MNVFIWFLIFLMAIVLVLSAVLAMTFFRLSRELRQLGADTETMLNRAGRAVRAVQIAGPLIALVRQVAQNGTVYYKKMRAKGKRHGKAAK
jgi:hypothetical protein